jgi:hypothetical protein
MLVWCMLVIAMIDEMKISMHRVIARHLECLISGTRAVLIMLIS